ncbi:MAG TPA: sugar phosphate nucleotidyltransferase, partial [Candidatus Nitrosotalea sp.]|nr:sugar phosphate nucleotidyltransferase [Candidatus Nitrosotalea sp.]
GLIDDSFVCLYGDSIFDFNLKSMIESHHRKKSFVTMGLSEYKTKLQYGFIEMDKVNRVNAWREKPEVKGNINIGCYVMEPGIFKFIPTNKPYGMDDVIRSAITKKNKVSGHLVKNGFLDIGDKASYRRAYQQYITRLGRI